MGELTGECCHISYASPNKCFLQPSLQVASSPILCSYAMHLEKVGACQTACTDPSALGLGLRVCKKH